MSTAIQWTDETWNPTTGCTKVSEGCRNCYIETTTPFRVNKRKFVNGKTDIQLHHNRLDTPLHWKKPRRVFVNSLSDLFHEDIPDEFIHQVFAVMALCSQHTFQILTKRPDRMRRLLSDTGDEYFWALVEGSAQLAYSEMHPEASKESISMGLAVHGPLPNVWLGVSIEDQRTADERIPQLLKTSAAVRFISAEPLLADVNLVRWLTPFHGMHTDHKGLDWVIVGGESGPGARPCDVFWLRGIKNQCQNARVPVFVKQLGAVPYDSVAAWKMLDRLYTPTQEQAVSLARFKFEDKKGGDPAEWPADLRVREFPGGGH